MKTLIEQFLDDDASLDLSTTQAVKAVLESYFDELGVDDHLRGAAKDSFVDYYKKLVKAESTEPHQDAAVPVQDTALNQASDAYDFNTDDCDAGGDYYDENTVPQQETTKKKKGRNIPDREVKLLLQSAESFIERINAKIPVNPTPSDERYHALTLKLHAWMKSLLTKDTAVSEVSADEGLQDSDVGDDDFGYDVGGADFSDDIENDSAVKSTAVAKNPDSELLYEGARFFVSASTRHWEPANAYKRTSGMILRELAAKMYAVCQDVSEVKAELNGSPCQAASL